LIKKILTRCLQNRPGFIAALIAVGAVFAFGSIGFSIFHGCTQAERLRLKRLTPARETHAT